MHYLISQQCGVCPDMWWCLSHLSDDLLNACSNTRTVVSRRIRNAISIYLFFSFPWTICWHVETTRFHAVYDLCLWHLQFVPLCMYLLVVWRHISLDKNFTPFILAIKAGCYAQWNARILQTPKNVTSNLFFIHHGPEDPGIESRQGRDFPLPSRLAEVHQTFCTLSTDSLSGR